MNLMRLLGPLLFPVLPTLALACPPIPDQADRRATLLADLKGAATFSEGRGAIDRLWMLWRKAPDEASQELLNAGMQAIRYGDYLRAEQTLRRLTRYCPEYAEGWNQLAFVFFLQERDEPSIAALMRTLELEPAHFGALAGLALIHLRAGRSDLGQDWLRRAVDVNPWLNERHLLEPTDKDGPEL